MQLIERDQELERLLADFSDADRGDGRVVLVRGEAGIGKSALIGEFSNRIAGQAHILLGVCDDLLAQRALGPIRDMAFDEPGLASALAAGIEETNAAILDLLDRSLRPTLIVIEDVHWADDATFDLIRHVGKRITTRKGMIVLTYRDEELHQDHPLRFVLSDLPPHSVDRIELKPLSRDGVAKVTGPTANTERIFEESGGNPFLAVELAESGSDHLPQSVVDVFVGRLARLEIDARDLVELISVVPGRMALATVMDLFDNWATHLDEAEKRGLLRITGSNVSFRHELARRAIESQLTSARRIDLNRRVLGYLRADQTADVARIVHHASESREIDTLIEVAPLAAREALSVGSNSQALQYFETLANHYQRFPAEERAALLDDWSYAAHVVNRLREALSRNEEAMALWRDIGDPVGLGRSLRWNSRLEWLSGRRDRAVSSADEAVRVLETTEVSAELAYAYSTQAQLMMLAYDNEPAIERADRAIEVANKVGNKRIVAHAIVNRATAIAHIEALDAETREPRFDALIEALEFAEQIQFWDEAARAAVNMAWAGLEAGDIDRAEQFAVKTIDICDVHELPAMRHYAVGTLAEAKRRQGKWHDAEDLTRESLSHPGVWATNEILNRSVLGSILARRGDADAKVHLNRAWELAQETREAQRTILVSMARAEMSFLRGDDKLARRIIEEEIERNHELDVPWFWSELIFLAHRLGIDVSDANRVRDPHRSAVVGDYTSAAAGFEQLGMPYEAAIVLLNGSQEEAIRGLSLLDELGATATAVRARADLRRRGVSNLPRVRKSGNHPGRSGLTNRQLEVMELLKDGLTNAEIAHRLFVSHRTVDHHVSAILSKLGVSTRQEAVDEFTT